MNTINFSLFVSLVLCSAVSCGQQESDLSVCPLSVSSDGSALLSTVTGGFGLQYVDQRTSAAHQLVEPDYTCMYVSLSPDGRRAAYKDFDELENGERMQIPSVYLASGDVRLPLCEAREQCGNPALGPNGLVAFAEGNVFRIIRLGDDGNREDLLKKDLGFPANTCDWAPDGSEVVLTSPDGKVFALNATSGTLRDVGKLDGAYGPRVSPDGQRAAFTAADGRIGIVSLAGTGSAPMRVLPAVEGGRPELAWCDAQTLSYTEMQVHGDRVVSSKRLALCADEEQTTRLLDRREGETVFVQSGCQRIASSDLAVPTVEKRLVPRPNNSVITNGSSVLLDGYIPYINQKYDVLDSFPGGGSCCNAASCLIAVQYYNRLKARPYTVSWGGAHTSNWGYYISQTYSYNGRTFNVKSNSDWGSDLAGFTGGFGYFLQDSDGSSLQRSIRLKEYISYHNITSSVDQSPTIDKARTEVDNGYPTVMLVSITSSGHYITCTGYVKNQHTLIFHDPYGNKNVAYPSKDGVRAYYDWPGWNNGYQNLVTVHRYIYARAANPTQLNVSAPGGNILGRGQSVQMSCIANMNKGGTKDLTSEVTWSVTSTSSVASISPAGLLSVSPSVTGTATVYVTASFQNLTNTYTMYVPKSGVEFWSEY